MRRNIDKSASRYEEACSIAEEAYIFGYPLLVLDVARRIHTAVSFATTQGAPANEFAHSRELAGPHDKDKSRPHADSLTSVAWLDLSNGPVILSVPGTIRYFMLAIWNAWYDLVEVISSRTVGGTEKNFAIVGPGWQEPLPDSLEIIECSTEMAWIDGRFQTIGFEDLENVHRLQDEMRITPLIDWGGPAVRRTHPFRINTDTATPPQEQVARFDAATFYTRLSRLLRRTTPRAVDVPMVERLREIGVSREADLVFGALPSMTSQAMRTAIPTAQHRIADAELISLRPSVGSWSLQVHPGKYETNYLGRAVAVRSRLASSVAEDVVCFYTSVDQMGDSLKGSNHYVIHFDHNNIPPVNAFWSLTLYNSKRLLAANAIHRHVISDLDKLRVNTDSSISIFIQHDWPGVAIDSNWLPAPKDAFELVLQLYWPKPEAWQGRWRPPAAARIR